VKLMSTKHGIERQFMLRIDVAPLGSGLLLTVELTKLSE